MKAKESVPLKNVIKKLLGDERSIKYLTGLDFAYANSDDIYQGALANLLNGQTEKTLKCLIFALDLDRENVSIIHLSRTMLFSLSEDFYENSGELFRQKYSDLNKGIEQIKKKLSSITKNLDEINKEINDIEETINKEKKNFLFFFFKKSKLNKQLETAKAQYQTTFSEVEKFKDELENVSMLSKIEEYMKVLSLMLEVCIFPTRFNWALSKN